MTKRTIVTVSIMISGKLDSVKRCLDSIQPLLKQVPSELILTDTGCQPEVRKLIEKYTNHIIDFVWCNDFSAARNVGLKDAKGEWFLYLDDDEWFENTEGIVSFLLSEEQKKYNVAYYTQRNYFSADVGKYEILQTIGSSQYRDHYVDRIIRITPELHFEHRVHEEYVGVKIGKKKRINSYVHHYGYAYANEDDRRAKYERNQQLLEIECKEHPNDMRMWYQMAIAPRSLGKWDESIIISRKAISRESNSCYWDAIHTNVLCCLESQRKWLEMLEVGETFLEKKQLFPYFQFGIHQYIIKACWKLEKYEKLWVHAKSALNIYIDYINHPEDYEINQLLNDEFWQKDRISSMLLMIVGTIYHQEDEEANRILLNKDLYSNLSELFHDKVYCQILEEMVFEGHPTEKKIRMLEMTPFGRGDKTDYWMKKVSEMLEKQEYNVSSYVRPLVKGDNCQRNGNNTQNVRDMLIFPKGFFDGEIRNGFYIEPFMKNAWAAEIAVLKAIGKICQDNNLRYYVDWGTLLGTVRHHGFIPWDDDIDICMPRNDMLQLAQIIEQNHPEWKFLDIYNEKDHGMTAIRVVSGFDLLTKRDEIKDSYGFPLPVGIDIFVLDNLPDDEADRKEIKDVQVLCTMAFNLRQEINKKSVVDEDYFSRIRLFQATIMKIQNLCHMSFSDEFPECQEILILLDEVQGMYANQECQELTQMNSFCCFNYSVSMNDYEDIIMMPFENIMVPVPIGYDNILRKKYGDEYMIPEKKDAGHDYPFYGKMLESVHEQNPTRNFENMKEEIIANSSGFYHKFINQSSKPQLVYGEIENEEQKIIRAAESEVIAEIQRVCGKHGITIYAIGYDDEVVQNGEYGLENEIHLGLFRQDYMKFLSILPRELDSWFDYRDIYHTEEHEELKLYVITDAYQTNKEEYMERFHGCPYIVGIDIAPIDIVSDDENSEQICDVLFTNLVTTAGSVPDKPPYNEEVLQIVQQWYELTNIRINQEKNIRNEFYRAADTVVSLCKENKSRYVKVFADNCKYERSCFEKVQEVSFGNVSVLVPIG